MQWDSFLRILNICFAYLLLTWLWVCIFHVWDVFDASVLDTDVTLITVVISIVVALLIAVILIHSPVVAFRRVAKHCIVAFLLADFIMGSLLVLWMPYHSYSWEVVVIVTFLLFVVAVLMAVAHYNIRSTWYPLFRRHSKPVAKHEEMRSTSVISWNSM
jgi:hypothetical protein